MRLCLKKLHTTTKLIQIIYLSKQILLIHSFKTPYLILLSMVYLILLLSYQWLYNHKCLGYPPPPPQKKKRKKKGKGYWRESMYDWPCINEVLQLVDCFVSCYWLRGLFCVLLMVTWTVLVMVTWTVLSSGDGYVDCFEFWWWLCGLFCVLVMVTWTVLSSGDGYVDCFVSC